MEIDSKLPPSFLHAFVPVISNIKLGGGEGKRQGQNQERSVAKWDIHGLCCQRRKGYVAYFLKRIKLKPTLPVDLKTGP